MELHPTVHEYDIILWPGIGFFLFLGGEIYTETRLCWFWNGRRTAEITTVGGEVQTRSKQGATTFEILYKTSCHFNAVFFLSLNTKEMFSISKPLSFPNNEREV